MKSLLNDMNWLTACCAVGIGGELSFDCEKKKIEMEHDIQSSS